MGTTCKWCHIGRQLFGAYVERFVARRRTSYNEVESRDSTPEQRRAIRLRSSQLKRQGLKKS